MSSHDHGHPGHRFVTAVNPDLMKLQGRHERISFTDVTFRVFALPASFNRLQMFCDNYLNFPDDPDSCSNGYYFKAAAPVVTLSVINYGKMSTETENLGWIAQHEVLFSVPVEMYKVDDKGRLIFHDWGYVCPFIYVDNDQSLGVGREVYGWTKVRGWLHPSTATWTADPREARRLLSLETELFPNLYTGESQEPRTLVEIYQDPPMSLFRSPFSPDDPNNPWWALSRNMRRSAMAMNDAFQFFSGLPVFGYAGTRHTGTASRMYRRLMQNTLNGMSWLKSGYDTRDRARSRGHENSASPYMNNLTLKQFRDAQNPDLACYQALVNSKISIEKLTDCGLLGGQSLLMGDVTGGYRIHVHEYAEQPIVETLGIEVSETIHDKWGKKVSVLAPILPNWMACDLRYDTGTTLCWRSKDSSWFDEANEELHPAHNNLKNRYNTTLGAAIQDVAGPFHYPDTTLRIFPLMADKDRLTSFSKEVICDLKEGEPGAEEFENIVKRYETKREALKTEFLNGKESIDADTMAEFEARPDVVKLKKKLDDEAARFADEFLPPDNRPVADDNPDHQHLSRYVGLNHFTPNGSSIYMVVTTYGEEYGKMYNEDNNLGRTARREVAFFLPVNWYSWHDEARCVQSRRVMLSPFVFCDSMRHVLSDTEVNGLPAIHSIIESDDDWWLRESGPHAKRKVLATLRTLLMPALHAGQPAEIRELMEVVEGDIQSSRDDGGSDPASALDIKRAEAEAARLYRDLGKPGSDIDFMYLKQYRATQVIQNHCYQALVLVRKRVEHVWPNLSRKIEEPIHLCVHAYPSMPIVRQLGIRVNCVDTRESAIRQQIMPISPFAMRVSLKEDLGTNLYSRVRRQAWNRESDKIDF